MSCLLCLMYFRNYYFYEFGSEEQHVALVAAVSSGKVCPSCYMSSVPWNLWKSWPSKENLHPLHKTSCEPWCCMHWSFLFILVCCRLSLQELLHPRVNGTLMAYGFALLLSLWHSYSKAENSGLNSVVFQRMEPARVLGTEFRLSASTFLLAQSSTIFMPQDRASLISMSCWERNADEQTCLYWCGGT